MTSKKQKQKKAASKKTSTPRRTPGQVLMKAAKAMPLDRTMHERTSIANLDKRGAETGRWAAAAPPTMLASVVDDKTEEQKQVAAAGQALRVLLQKPVYLGIYAAMVRSRQANAIAFRELQTELAAESDLPQLTQDCFIGAVALAASKPFSEHDFVNGLISDVMPWLANVIDGHAARDAVQAQEAMQQAETVRRARSLPLGFKHTIECEEPTLTRERSLTLVGWAPAVNWLLHQISNTVGDDPAQFIILRLHGSDQQRRPASKNYITIGPGHWSGCCNSTRTLAETMRDHALAQLSGPPDLVICDDLSLAHTTSYTGRDSAAVAGDAHKVLAQWCRGVGAALVCGVPRALPVLPDMLSIAFEQFRVFSTLRPLRVVDEAPDLVQSKTRLILHNSAAVFEVDKAELDAHAPHRVVV